MSDNIGVDRSEFDRLLAAIRPGKQDSEILAPAGGVRSDFTVVSRIAAALGRVDRLQERYQGMLEHDVDVALSACDRLEQVDLAQARRISGQDGMASFSASSGDGSGSVISRGHGIGAV